MFCPFCGAQVSEGVRFCGGCGNPVSQQPAPSVVPLPEPAQPDSITVQESRLARLGDRFLALVLDTLLVAGVFAAAGMATALRFGGITEQGFSFEGTPAALSVGVTLVTAFLYHWLCEGLFGATLGKAMIGLRVQLTNGRRCNLRSSLIRNLLRLIDGLAVYLVGFLAALLSKRRQRLGDLAAGTVVVETAPGRLARAGLVLLWLALLGFGFGGAYLLHRGAPVSAAPTAADRSAPEPKPSSSSLSSRPAMSFTSNGTLKVTNFDFLAGEGGPSRPPAPYVPGEKVFLKYDIVGYSTDAEGRPKLQYDIAAYDPNGLVLHTPWRDEFARQIERDSPVHGTFRLEVARAVPSGTCKVVIQVRDELNHTGLQLTAPFEVKAAALAPANSLEVRDFELSSAESGPAVTSVELQGGGTVYMRCNVFGMQFRGDEAEVRMAVRLAGPGGKVVFEKPDYGTIHDTWAYHPPTFHVPVSGRLSLPSGSEKGSYTVAYTFTDTISGQAVSREGRAEVK